MMRLFFAFFILPFSVQNGFGQIEKSHFSKLQKRLEGAWKLPDEIPNEQYFETWKRVDSRLSLGQSFMVKNERDTVVLENVRLEKRADGGVFYVVKSPNEQISVEFKLASAGSKKWLFENPSHDFPQKIEYDFLSRDVLRASISGPFNGEEKTFFFPYSRVKNWRPYQKK